MKKQIAISILMGVIGLGLVVFAGLYALYRAQFPCGRKPKLYTDIESALHERNRVCILVLNSRHLSQFPPELEQLTQLRVLTMADNQLNTIPPTISILKHLETLNLAQNQITELPPEIGDLTELQVLSLSYNRLTHLPNSIARLKKLVALDIVYNPLSAEEKARIKALFPSQSIVIQLEPILPYLPKSPSPT